MKTALVQARMKPSVKNKAERILKNLGLNGSQVVNMLYHQIILHRGIPFSVSEIEEIEKKKSVDE